MPPRRKKNPGGRPNEFSEELRRQQAEGVARSHLEDHEELELHEGARHDLHYLKAQAVATLQKAMLNTGTCPHCGEYGLVVEKTAVVAAMGVLDRSGLPPAKDIRVEDKRQVLGEVDILKRAVGALVTLEPEQLGLIVAHILDQRPDARMSIAQALAGQPLIAASAEA